ncbi:MAG: metallophosphoesterase, partial [Candidatus Marinimicrobia bacterium]|nr:metallophosphoesterase [Candidatus Neomarinimicrobiota bacterium]
MTLTMRLFLRTLLITTISWSLPADASEISFAWLTDLHVGASGGEADLRAVVADIRTEGAVSFAIVSGDVSELDVGPNLEIAKTLLDSMGIPYYIIPGNHDTKWSSSGGGNFRQLWGSDRFTFETDEYRFIGIHQGPILRMGD